MAAPGADVVEIVAGRNGRTGEQQQYLLEWVHHPPGFAIIADIGKMLEQNGKTAPRYFLVKGVFDYGKHEWRSWRITAPGDHNCVASRLKWSNQPR